MEKKRIKKKIGVGSILKAKVGELEDNTREERISRIRKDVVEFFQAVVGKKKISVQLKYLKKEDISSCLIVCLFSKYEVDMDDPISNLPEK